MIENQPSRERPTEPPVASCFISYSHADKELATAITANLRLLGYHVWIDEGELRVGDSLIEAISAAIDQVDFLVALVSENSVDSNWCRKEISLAMTGEIGQSGITVLPCRVGAVTMPPALADKLYLLVNPNDPGTATHQLHMSMTQHLAPAQSIPPRRRTAQQKGKPASTDAVGRFTPMTEIRMIGIDTNSMTSPRNDGTPGSALYLVPITLSATPDRIWVDLFVRHWNRPSQWTTMHRPGIASVAGNRIKLDGTNLEEVERYHLDTLKLAVAAANSDRKTIAEREQRQHERLAQQRREQEEAARDLEDRLNFE